MKKYIWFFLLTITLSGFSQIKKTPLTLFKAAIKLKNGEVIYKILYEIKKDKIILIEDTPSILSQIKSENDLKFSSVFVSDSIISLKIRRKNYFINYIGKSILIGSAVGFLTGYIANLGNQDNSFADLIIVAGTVYGGALGLITSPIVLLIPRKSYRKDVLKEQFPDEDLKIFSVKWQLENRKLMQK